MIEIDATLTEKIEAEVGDSLRIIATYDNRDVDVEYIRDDLSAQYSEEEIARVFDQLEIEGMGYTHFEKLFHIGEMDCAIYGFEGALIFHFPQGSFSGLAVSIDRNVELNPESIISKCALAMPDVEESPW